MAEVAVVLNEAAIRAFLESPAGPVGEFLVDVTQQVTQRAKELAPVGARSKTPEGHPSGYLRSRIDWQFVGAIDGLATEVSSPAITSTANPFPLEPYALHIEDPSTRPRKPPPFARDDRPYLVPALNDIFDALNERGPG